MPNRNILLVEPGYRNKYPPLGLMKIAAYHGPFGKKDTVVFVKGDRPEVFGFLDDMVGAGKVRHYGVSVETVDEAHRALRHPRVETVQIIFNIFRQRPVEKFFAEAQKRKVGILARVPLASGMLSGKISRASKFAKDDHRNFNRHGEAFDRGETFSGVDFDIFNNIFIL